MIDISDRNNYKVVKEYTPPDYVPSIPSTSSNKNIIIVSVLSSVGSLIIVVGCGYFLIRRRRNRIDIPTSYSLQKPMTC